MVALPKKKLYYAVEAVLYIAYNASHGPIASRDIAQRQGLPPRYLEQLMQKLVRGGNFTRGCAGRMAVMCWRAKGGALRWAISARCWGDEKEEMNGYGGTPLGNKIVLPAWEKAHEGMMEHLKQVNLAELCEQALAKSNRKVSDEKINFAI